MNLKERINNDFVVAYKNKDMDKKNFLGVLKGAIQTQEGKGVESTDENVLKVLKSVSKGLTETIETLKNGNLDFSNENKELDYINEYMPTLMSEDEIRGLVKEMLSTAENKNIGFLMGTFVKTNNGKAFDAKTVSKVINEELV